jgi:hypothetical protein
VLSRAFGMIAPLKAGVGVGRTRLSGNSTAFGAPSVPRTRPCTMDGSKINTQDAKRAVALRAIDISLLEHHIAPIFWLRSARVTVEEALYRGSDNTRGKATHKQVVVALEVADVEAFGSTAARPGRAGTCFCGQGVDRAADDLDVVP